MPEAVPFANRKVALTIFVTILIITLGIFYQYYYLEERREYEQAIGRYYFKLYGKGLDARELRRLSTIALSRYGPTEIYRTDEDYKKLFHVEGPKA